MSAAAVDAQMIEPTKTEVDLEPSTDSKQSVDTKTPEEMSTPEEEKSNISNESPVLKSPHVKIVESAVVSEEKKSKSAESLDENSTSQAPSVIVEREKKQSQSITPKDDSSIFEIPVDPKTTTSIESEKEGGQSIVSTSEVETCQESTTLISDEENASSDDTQTDENSPERKVDPEVQCKVDEITTENLDEEKSPVVVKDNRSVELECENEETEDSTKVDESFETPPCTSPEGRDQEEEQVPAELAIPAPEIIRQRKDTEEESTDTAVEQIIGRRDTEEDPLSEPAVVDADEKPTTAKVGEETKEPEDKEDGIEKPSGEKEGDDPKSAAYVPKNSRYYEHDARDPALKDDSPEAESKERPPRRSYVDRQTKWKHDRFDEREQAPKSQRELVRVYGYDIKKEQEPPKEAPLPLPKRRNDQDERRSDKKNLRGANNDAANNQKSVRRRRSHSDQKNARKEPTFDEGDFPPLRVKRGDAPPAQQNSESRRQQQHPADRPRRQPKAQRSCDDSAIGRGGRRQQYNHDAPPHNEGAAAPMRPIPARDLSHFAADDRRGNNHIPPMQFSRSRGGGGFGSGGGNRGGGGFGPHPRFSNRNQQQHNNWFSESAVTPQNQSAGFGPRYDENDWNANEQHGAQREMRPNYNARANYHQQDDSWNYRRDDQQGYNSRPPQRRFQHQQNENGGSEYPSDRRAAPEPFRRQDYNNAVADGQQEQYRPERQQGNYVDGGRRFDASRQSNFPPQQNRQEDGRRRGMRPIRGGNRRYDNYRPEPEWSQPNQADQDQDQGGDFQGGHFVAGAGDQQEPSVNWDAPATALCNEVRSIALQNSAAPARHVGGPPPQEWKNRNDDVQEVNDDDYSNARSIDNTNRSSAAATPERIIDQTAPVAPPKRYSSLRQQQNLPQGGTVGGQATVHQQYSMPTYSQQTPNMTAPPVPDFRQQQQQLYDEQYAALTSGLVAPPAFGPMAFPSGANGGQYPVNPMALQYAMLQQQQQYYSNLMVQPDQQVQGYQQSVQGTLQYANQQPMMKQMARSSPQQQQNSMPAAHQMTHSSLQQ